MTAIYKRVLEKKTECRMTWDELAHAAGIGLSSWMTGVPIRNPPDKDLIKIAPVLHTTFKWLKYGITE